MGQNTMDSDIHEKLAKVEIINKTTKKQISIIQIRRKE
jgi:hypothetical protein